LSQPVQAVTGTYITGTYSDANYIALSPSVFADSKVTGTVKLSLFFPYGSMGGGAGVQISADTAINFFVNIGINGNIAVRMPTTLGADTDQGTRNSVVKEGRYETLWLTYNATGYKLYSQDLMMDTTTLEIDRTYAAGKGTTNFDGMTKVYVGRSANADGHYSRGYIDNVEFLDEEISTDARATSLPHFFVQIGPSYVAGVGSNLSCAGEGNSYRWRIQNLSGRDKTKYYFAGGIVHAGNSGTVVTPYDDGVSGTQTEVMLQNINANVRLQFISPTARTGVLLALVEGNDAAAGINLDVFQARVEALVNSVVAFSPVIPIWMITTPEFDVGHTVGMAAYAQRVRDAYAARKAAGANVNLIDWAAQSAGVVFCDGVHYDKDGYDMLGDVIYTGLTGTLEDSPTITPTHTASPTVTATPVLTATPTQNPTLVATYSVRRIQWKR
jgi:hypothetical protein